ncbi:MAG: RAMP superfamily CRISPR-associated protein [Anaerolineae bacterium]
MNAPANTPADLPIPMRMALKVTFDTPVNIGGYGAPTFVDRPFRRDSDGWPFIPASSLKGRLRHECERLARALGDDKVCNGPDPSQMCRGEEQDVCSVCKIWGSPWVAGRVYPVDLKLERPTELGNAAPPSTVRYNVSISRRRRVAEDARLFTTELFLPGIPLTFSGVWETYLSLRELVLVEAGLGAITALGRAKSGGLGWCVIRSQTEMQVNGTWRSVTAGERMKGRAAWQK